MKTGAIKIDHVLYLILSAMMLSMLARIAWGVRVARRAEKAPGRVRYQKALARACPDCRAASGIACSFAEDGRGMIHEGRWRATDGGLLTAQEAATAFRNAFVPRVVPPVVRSGVSDAAPEVAAETILRSCERCGPAGSIAYLRVDRAFTDDGANRIRETWQRAHGAESPRAVILPPGIEVSVPERVDRVQIGGLTVFLCSICLRAWETESRESATEFIGALRRAVREA